jgi:hypothetical protein
MPDYTSFRKVFNAIPGGASTGGKLPPLPEQPKIAGYLPAPPEARFISSAEEAAKKLPPTVKAESIRNELLKRGAKPVELDYALLDGFATAHSGQRVSADSIHDKLVKDGPLGQLWRVEQQPMSESVAAGVPRDIASEIKETGPFLANPRSTYNPEMAYPDTVYHPFTEQGRRGDNSGYREVLFDDPRNPSGSNDFDRFDIGHAQPINAHSASYWVRYHNNPDSIAVQNIQSDVGQQWAKRQEQYKKEISARKGDGPEQPIITDEMIERHGPVPTVDELADARLKLQDLRREYGEDLDDLPMDGEGYYDSLMEIFRHPAVAHLREPIPPAPVSPLAKDDNWKNFLARQVILEAAKEGKPISLPTGANANAVEHMPEHAATHFYEKDMPERIRKIIKSFDPKDGARTEVVSGQPQQPFGFVVRGSRLSESDAEGIVNAAKAAAVSGRQRRSGETAGLYNRSESNIARDLDWIQDAFRWTPEDGDSDVTSVFGRLSHAAMDESVPVAARNEAQRVLSSMLLAKERGSNAPSLDASQARREGTWIHMSPVARREILEKGMPIMSVGAGALLGGLNDQSSDR